MSNPTLDVLATWEKQPGEVQDYDIDFGDWLKGLNAGQGDTPAAVSPLAVTATTGITVDSFFLYGTVAKVWLSGGTHRQRYKITATLTTTGGRVKQAEFVVFVREV